MSDPHLVIVILGRSDRRSLSERNLQHRSAECLIRDKDRPAPDLHCRPAINGGHDADFREIARTKPER